MLVELASIDSNVDTDCKDAGYVPLCCGDFDIDLDSGRFAELKLDILQLSRELVIQGIKDWEVMTAVHQVIASVLNID